MLLKISRALLLPVLALSACLAYGQGGVVDPTLEKLQVEIEEIKERLADAVAQQRVLETAVFDLKAKVAIDEKGTINVLKMDDPPVPFSRPHAAHNARAFQRAIKLARYGGTLYIPAGVYYTHGWGPVYEDNFGVAGMRGDGRKTVIYHVDSPVDDGIDGCMVFKSQAAMHDAFIRDIGFESEVDEPVFVFEGYSVVVDNLYVKGAGTSSEFPVDHPHQVGITIKGQHVTLNHCQVEFCAVGVSLPKVYGLVANNLNIEYNTLGLSVTNDAHFRGFALLINGLYSEGNRESMYAEQTSFSLGGYSGIGAIRLHDCRGCTLDFSTSDASNILLTGNTTGCHTYLPLTPDARYSDDSDGSNTFQFGVTRDAVVEPLYSEDIATMAPGSNNDHYHRLTAVYDVGESEQLDLELGFTINEFANMYLQFYDYKSKELWDFELKSWGSKNGITSLALQYTTNTPSFHSYSLPADGQDRRVLVSLINRDAPGTVYKLHTPISDWGNVVDDKAPTPTPVP